MQVSDNFGPIYQSVVLDGSGNGAVSFQATGSNIRLTNIFFNVSSATNQAVCNIYKGQIAAGNIVFNSNSGSTGARVGGNLDLFDGETCFVVWTGGDPGATGTATFTGGKIPFGDVRPSVLEGSEPFAAGDGTIIFPALKSPDYVQGVSGWRISRSGEAEFNDVIARGVVRVNTEVGNGYVEINDYANFAGIELMPEFAVANQEPARIFAINDVTLSEWPLLSLLSPNFEAAPEARINLFGERLDQSLPTTIELRAEETNVYGNLSVEGVAWPGRWSDQLTSNQTAVTSTVVTPFLTVTLPAAGKYTFECDFIMTVITAVSRPGFALGGTCTPVDWRWGSDSRQYNNATGTQAFTSSGTSFNSTGVALVNSDWSVSSGFSGSRVWGTVNVSAAGTLTFGISRATGTGGIEVKQGSMARVAYEG